MGRYQKPITPDISAELLSPFPVHQILLTSEPYAYLNPIKIYPLRDHAQTENQFSILECIRIPGTTIYTSFYLHKCSLRKL